MPEPTLEQVREVFRAQRAAVDDESRVHAESLMRKYGVAEEPPPDLVHDAAPAPGQAPEVDPAVLALAIATARGEGDEESARKLEAMIPQPAPALTK